MKRLEDCQLQRCITDGRNPGEREYQLACRHAACRACSGHFIARKLPRIVDDIVQSYRGNSFTSAIIAFEKLKAHPGNGAALAQCFRDGTRRVSRALEQWTDSKSIAGGMAVFHVSAIPRSRGAIVLPHIHVLALHPRSTGCTFIDKLELLASTLTSARIRYESSYVNQKRALKAAVYFRHGPISPPERDNDEAAASAYDDELVVMKMHRGIVGPAESESDEPLLYARRFGCFRTQAYNSLQRELWTDTFGLTHNRHPAPTSFGERYPALQHVWRMRRCPCCRALHASVSRNGHTDGGVQRYACTCGKTFSKPWLIRPSKLIPPGMRIETAKARLVLARFRKSGSIRRAAEAAKVNFRTAQKLIRFSQH